jgi:hypothetical protein
VLLIINNPPKATSESSIDCEDPSECIISYIQSLKDNQLSSEFSNFDAEPSPYHRCVFATLFLGSFFSHLDTCKQAEV